jgi:hypothetical protein
LTEPILEPDYPSPFGYKTAWYAIKCDTPDIVIEKLGLRLISKANWESGIRCIYARGDIFVSPFINGYLLSIGLIDVTQENVIEHSLLFDELQYFATHRVVEFHAWAKFADHNLIRAYSYCGDQGEISWNFGALTEIEKNLELDKLPKSSDDLV